MFRMLLVLAITSASFGATLLVPEEYSTIQAALDAAQTDNLVSVAPGVYPESVVFRSDRITLQSRVPQGATIDGGGKGDAVSCTALTATVEGFKLTGGTLAGVSASRAAQVTIRGNMITENNVAGIILESGSTAWIEGNTITDNRYSNPSGWGIRCRTRSSATIVNNYISGYYSGIESNHGESLAIVNNTLRNNLYCLYLNETRSVVQNNILASSNYGVCFRTAATLDWSTRLTESLSLDHNNLWENSVADYYLQLDPPCVEGGGIIAGAGCIPFGRSGPFLPSPGMGEMHVDPILDGDGPGVQSDSPVIDAGENAAVPSGVNTDLSGGTRILNGIVDIGACEFPGPDIGPVDPAGPLLPICGAGTGQASLLSLMCIALVRLRRSGRRRV